MNEPERMLIRAPLAPLHADSCDLAEQVTQSLLGDEVALLETRQEWSRVRMWDQYIGWVKREHLVPAPPDWRAPWMEIEDLWVNIRPAPDSHTAARTFAFLGSRFPLIEDDGRWWKLRLPDGEAGWIEQRRARPVQARPTTTGAICTTARRFLGTPYIWGGCSAWGLDCSGFVQLVYRLHGISLHRDAGDQSLQGGGVETPEQGDLVFFGPAAEGRISHVGLMLDGDRFIHAHGGRSVRISNLSQPEWRTRYRLARRYIPELENAQEPAELTEK